MSLELPPFLPHDLAWLVVVPKRAEFCQPAFHFGERVKFWPRRKQKSIVGDRAYHRNGICSARVLGVFHRAG